MNDNIFTLAAPRRPAPDHVLVCRLALERCQQHLAHLHATLHLCMPEQAQDENFVAMGSIRKLIANLAQELSYSMDTLGLCEE